MDPVVLSKMWLLGYLFNMTSERGLWGGGGGRFEFDRADFLAASSTRRFPTTAC